VDVFETSAKVLSLALSGASQTKILSAGQNLRQDEVKWLLRTLVDRKLLENESGAYWTTIEGVKYLEIQFQMERILQAQKSLV
jgi:hypothetical protein